MIQAVSESYRVLPVLGFHVTGDLQNPSRCHGTLFVIAAKISAPIVVALLLAGRPVRRAHRSQINIFIVGFLQIAIGLIGIVYRCPCSST